MGGVDPVGVLIPGGIHVNAFPITGGNRPGDKSPLWRCGTVEDKSGENVIRRLPQLVIPGHGVLCQNRFQHGSHAQGRVLHAGTPAAGIGIAFPNFLRGRHGGKGLFQRVADKIVVNLMQRRIPELVKYITPRLFDGLFLLFTCNDHLIFSKVSSHRRLMIS